MKIVRMKDHEHDMVAGALFPKGPVERRMLINKAESEQLSFTLLSFAAGTENAFHIHTNDQAILVTEGVAVCATETERFEVTAADLVIFPAGENHMHGPAPGHSCSFLSITPAGTTTTVT
jgi:quercetin dioxygenase-like cupin family protein